MEACNWYGPTAPLGSVAERSATPSVICCRSQSARSCCASGINSPSAPVRASVGQQHEGEQPGDLRVVRLQMADDPSQAHRLMRQIGSAQMGSDAARVALVENEVLHVYNCEQALRALPRRPQLECDDGI